MAELLKSFIDLADQINWVSLYFWHYVHKVHNHQKSLVRSATSEGGVMLILAHEGFLLQMLRRWQCVVDCFGYVLSHRLMGRRRSPLMFWPTTLCMPAALYRLAVAVCCCQSVRQSQSFSLAVKWTCFVWYITITKMRNNEIIWFLGSCM